MKIAIIIGSTGLIGHKLTEQLLNDNRYSKVTILVRKKARPDHPKLEQLVFDFDNPDISVFKGNELYCCLGTTIKTAGTKEAFYKVDYNYVLNSAKQAKQNGIAKLAVISSMGANKRSSAFYTKTKSEMEDAVAGLNFDSCFILRPSLLLGNRKEFRFGEKIATLLMKSLSFIIPDKYKGIKDEQVAKAMIHFMNTNEKGNHIIENNLLLLV